MADILRHPRFDPEPPQRIVPWPSFTASEIRDRPPVPQWIWDGLIRRGTVTLLGGEAKIGKCLGKGTPVLMFDGSVRPVEEVQIGEELMGPDSKPRRVLALSSGIGPLFRVTPNKGEPYIVNENHVLSFKMTTRGRQRLLPFPVNLSVGQYLKTHKTAKKRLKGWRCGINWATRPVEIAPYLLGLWLGDGTARQPEITSADPEIIVPELIEFAEGTNLRVVVRDTGHQGAARSFRLTGTKGRPNTFTEALRHYEIYNDKSIPEDYLINDEETRLELLAGLIDTDGHLCGGSSHSYEITQKRSTLSNQIVFLARSLGFAATTRITMKRSQESELRPYHRIIIGGDISRIPAKLPHKRAKAKKSRSRDSLLTGVCVDPIAEGEYFGFEVDGDHLFLLGDFTVTHNSLLMQQLLSAAAVGMPCLGMHTERCRAYGYFCEDGQDDLVNRQFDIVAGLELEMLDLEEFHWISRAKDECVLADFEYGKMKLTPEWDALWRDISYHESELLAIDTARAVFQGNEFAPRQVTPFMRELQKQAIERNMAIILAIHPPGGNSAKGYAGTMAWFASARAGISLEYPSDYDRLQDGPTGERVLRGLGANYTGAHSTIRLRWNEGVFWPVEVEPLMPRVRGPIQQAILDDEMFKGLERHRDNGREVPADYDKAGSLPRSYRKTFGKGWAWNDLYTSQDRLVRDAKVLKVKVRGRCLVRPAAGKFAFPYQDEEQWP